MFFYHDVKKKMPSVEWQTLDVVGYWLTEYGRSCDTVTTTAYFADGKMLVHPPCLRDVMVVTHWRVRKDNFNKITIRYIFNQVKAYIVSFVGVCDDRNFLCGFDSCDKPKTLFQRFLYEFKLRKKYYISSIRRLR